ncbi:Cu+-exporting ATPase [Pustulibacterium marinum]|uniref:Cu+-exporting ATPase n=1 Tax=Pustulibacterium marinum TaxID=1224947 RepID=A0A1I7FB68_9FLAO|nr:heavy metal translocating P-type ATPase metal-binding domain-containing protein [Pustulibacterium marinum]SFU33402.1 Cu+-exporting ATPase [Pustulibacterium marinum]
MESNCYHCGNPCEEDTIVHDGKSFCCNGCKTVYEIFSENELTCYYDLTQNPGATPNEIAGKYDFLDQPSIAEKLLEFDDEHVQIVTLYIPHIHCSSCIWLLENLQKLQTEVSSSIVNFPKKTVRITYNSEAISLKEIVLLLCRIGYEPYISLEDYENGKKPIDRSLIYKLGVAGFAFGNVMLLSFPEYFEVDEFWLNQYKPMFRWIMFAMSLPVVFYAANDYFITAFKGIRSKFLNIDVPIALGISVLFIRSVFEIITEAGPGFLDSLTGLVFFLLLGKFFQQKTYNFLSFERDYKSYFPIGITKINLDGTEETVQVYDIEKGDRLLIRNEELIPVDGILIKGDAQIDYSFVTGEADAVTKQSGDKIFAGGKQTHGAIEMEALKSVSQSYLTQLWSNDVFNKNKDESFKNITDSISKYFTIAILLIAIISGLVWYFVSPEKAWNVVTAILIIACPCALALSAPFTMGNLLRILGKKKCYLKNANVLEQLAKIDTIIFDKTGTITAGNKMELSYEGVTISNEEEVLLKNTLRNSNHPLSRQLYSILKANNIVTLDSFEEHTGKGMEATFQNNSIKVGSSSFVGNATATETLKTAVHISTNNHYKGKYIFKNTYREGIPELFQELSSRYDISILSGDNESEKETLQHLLPNAVELHFNQKPSDKLEHIKTLQEKGKNVLMIGDGLNDAGALKQSNVGIAIAENVNVFSPACDAILDASKVKELAAYMKLSKTSIKIIKTSFILSFIYNIIGLSFAISGELSPVVAAILMPLSSISIVAFVTVATNMFGKNLK